MGSGLIDLLAVLSIKTYKQAMRLVRIVIGFTLFLVGVALIILPGPAIIVIPMGLVVLAGEFIWAKRLLHKFNHDFSDSVKGLRRFF